jgi:hypothetical protein
MERREDRVRLARLRARRAELVDRAESRMRVQLDAAALQRSPHSRAARPRERRHIAGEVKRARLRLARERGQLALGRPPAQQQPAAALAQLAVELGEALEQELRARPRCVAAVQQGLVEAEDRHHALALLQRRRQRRVIVHAQVAPKPDDRRQAPSIPAQAGSRALRRRKSI